MTDHADGDHHADAETDEFSAQTSNEALDIAEPHFARPDGRMRRTESYRSQRRDEVEPPLTERPSPSSHASPLDRLVIGVASDKLTHYLFRYPAKFHTPVARILLDQFTTPGDLVLDPFCGSGTLLVEALVTGRRSIGIDVDPVAVAVARAKTHTFRPAHLLASARSLLATLAPLERPADEYEKRNTAANDITEAEFTKASAELNIWIPRIPNLQHWFRRYVVIDLAELRRAILIHRLPETHRELFVVVFASIIRNASNADPVPVSGLEVTTHMLRRDARGRVVNPYALFRVAVERALKAHNALSEKAHRNVLARVIEGDATDIRRFLKHKVDAVITSPPYHGAVDYYRRHQLEMYWLGATESHAERLDLLHKYVGRPKVPRSHRFVRDGVLGTGLAKEWEARIREVDPPRADAFRHYLVAMTSFFDGLATRLDAGVPVVLVVGHSSWNQSHIPTLELFAEIAHADYTLDKTYFYPVRNRYMSYSRHNGADIGTEYVLVLRRR